jgi:hypothetical protein
MFRNLLLEPEQKDLLMTMVEAARNVSKQDRQGFIFDYSVEGSRIFHNGLPKGQVAAYIGDLEILVREGLLKQRYGSRGTPFFDVTPMGFKYYEHLNLNASQPVQRVEEKIMRYLNADNFQKKYARAFQKWSSANDKLWSTDSEKQLTEIGHLCREAMQEFVTVLVDHLKPPQVETNKTRTVARLRAVLKLKKGQLGNTVAPFLEALIAYWGTVSDLVQRQEHDSLKEGHPLVWEDGRRVVFQTAMVMFEIDASLFRK